MKKLNKIIKSEVFKNLYNYIKHNCKNIDSCLSFDINDFATGIQLKTKINELDLIDIGISGIYLVFIDNHYNIYKSEDIHNIIKKYVVY